MGTLSNSDGANGENVIISCIVSFQIAQFFKWLFKKRAGVYYQGWKLEANRDFSTW